MRQWKNVLIILIFIFLLAFTQGKRLYTWGSAEDIDLNVDGRVLHSYDNMDFVFHSEGYFDVYKNGLNQGRFSFGLIGVINGKTQKKLMSDYSWTPEIIEDSKEKISVRLTNDSPQFVWVMDLNLEQYSSLKITHSVTNNTGFDVTNAELLYLIDVNQTTNPVIFYEKTDGTIYQYDYSQNWHFTNQSVNFEDYYSRVRLGSFQFLFSDLIENNFFIKRTFFGNLNDLDAFLPDSNGFVLGFSKGNQTIANGTTIISDPTIKVSDTLDGYIQYKNGIYDNISTTSMTTGFLNLMETYSWKRNVIEFDLIGLKKVSNATLYLYHSGGINYGAHSPFYGSFDLNSITTLSGSIDSTDWNSTVYREIVSDWINETTLTNVEWVTANITKEWNDAFNSARDYVSFRIALNNDDSDATFTQACTGSCDQYQTYFCDTGSTSGYCTTLTDPYIDYNLLTNLDINIYSPIKGNYLGLIDGNHLIDFNVSNESGDTNYLMTKIAYSTSQWQMTNTIIDLNLLDMALNPIIDKNCEWDWNGFSTPKKCVYDWNFTGIADENYFVDFNLFTQDESLGYDSNWFVSSGNGSFQIDNTIPSTSWDGNHNVWQNTDVNIHLTCVDVGSCQGGDSNTSYRLDSDSSNAISYGDWLTFDLNVLITADGNYAIDFNSVDYVGNESDRNTFYVLIDSVLPSTSNLIPLANTDTALNEPTFSIDVSDALSGIAFCHYKVFKNNAEIYSGKETALAGTCSHTIESAYALAVGQTALIQWDVNDLAGNLTADENSAYYNRIETGSEGGGGGGGTFFIEVESQKVFTIIKPETSQLIFNVYPTYKQYEKFKLQNDLDSNQLLIITVSNDIFAYLKFDENSATKQIEFQGLQTQEILYKIEIPENTQKGKYFGTITLEDANRTIEIKVTINVQDKPIYAFAIEWLQQETQGIPNLIIAIVTAIIIYLIYSTKKQNLIDTKQFTKFFRGFN